MWVKHVSQTESSQCKRVADDGFRMKSFSHGIGFDAKSNQVVAFPQLNNLLSRKHFHPFQACQFENVRNPPSPHRQGKPDMMAKIIVGEMREIPRFSYSLSTISSRRARPNP